MVGVGSDWGQEGEGKRQRAAAAAAAGPFPTYQSTTMLPLAGWLAAAAADAADAHHPLHAAANRQALFPPDPAWHATGAHA